MTKVFLGGTCNGSKWRDQLIPKLKIDYFNPVIEDWTPEARQREAVEREQADYCLYVLTPKMKGVYSIAEVVDDSHKRPGKTIFCALREDGDDVFGTHAWKSLRVTGEMLKKNGATVLENLDEVADFLNQNAAK